VARVCCGGCGEGLGSAAPPTHRPHCASRLHVDCVLTLTCRAGCLIQVPGGARGGVYDDDDEDGDGGDGRGANGAQRARTDMDAAVTSTNHTLSPASLPHAPPPRFLTPGGRDRGTTRPGRRRAREVRHLSPPPHLYNPRVNICFTFCHFGGGGLCMPAGRPAAAGPATRQKSSPRAGTSDLCVSGCLPRTSVW